MRGLFRGHDIVSMCPSLFARAFEVIEKGLELLHGSHLKADTSFEGAHNTNHSYETVLVQLTTVRGKPYAYPP